MNRSFYYALLSMYNNCLLNIYFCGYLILPNYFLNKITIRKKLCDEYYNKLVLLSFTDNIYNKYQIDLIDIHAKLLNTYNNYKKNKLTYGLSNEYFNDDNDDNDDNVISSVSDNISIMSDISDIIENDNGDM